MVTNWPLIVQQWNPEIGMQKAEHSKLPVWVRMTDVPLEAWSIEGISALASLGIPLIIDAMTASMCHNGIGRMDFARVLVEMSAGKEFKKDIEVQYRDGENKIKWVKRKRLKTQEEIDMEKKEKKNRMTSNDAGRIDKGRNINQMQNNNSDKGRKQPEVNEGERENRSAAKEPWSINRKELEAMKKTANKYSILESLPDDDPVEMEILKGRMVVDQYIKKKIQPSILEAKEWTKDMIDYFKVQWGKDKEKAEEPCNNGEEEDDIVEELNELGDLNVTLNIEEHSSGGSHLTEEMQEFRSCINEVELEDIGSSGFYFTWTKSLKNPLASVMKKLDGVMVSDGFLDKPEFLKEVEEGWKNGDLTDRVGKTRAKLQEAQTLVEKNPHDGSMKEKAIQALCDYNEAAKDEEKFLAQKARVKWLMMRIKIVLTSIKSLKEEGDEAIDMIREVTNKEIKDAIFDVGDNRAPGPDGYSSLFFKRAWNIIGNDVCAAIKEFFVSGKMLGELNATLITLVPKIQTPSRVSEFRPIACCNVLYKCISKILTNRIKNALEKLVQDNQSAFIPRRVIQDNILLSQEILRGYGRKQGPKRRAMKIDLQKAYDTVNWDFLELILKKFGFQSVMVNWIMQCVRAAGFTVCINGERHGNNDCFKYHHGCKELKLVNLCFADDLMIFCNGDPIYVGLIKEGLEEFSAVSGLFPNLNKGVKECHALGSVFKLPKTVVKEINSILKRFLWSNGDSAKGKAKIAWKEVCRPKEYGGLGIKDLEKWNEGLLAKLLWNIASKKDTLWVKWIHMMKLKEGKIRFLTECSCDGSKVRLWYDNWHNNELLINHVTNRDLYDARVPKMITIAEIVEKGVWKWPAEWSPNEFEFMKLRAPNITNEVRDKVKWKDENSCLIPFHIKHVISMMSPNTEKVKWHNLVWFKQCIPKHSFCLWLAMNGRLLTQDRIMAWGNNAGFLCPLCNKVNDSHNHLLFSCDYSKKIWSEFADKMNLERIDFIWEKIGVSKKEVHLIAAFLLALRFKGMFGYMYKFVVMEVTCEYWKCSNMAVELSVNRSVTSCLVMPLIRASLLKMEVLWQR
ncbi:RNA-directed DNA polymerase, eukaryota, reverse transcriptase zinc-binding domain protein [Tanacetum coccineum]